MSDDLDITSILVLLGELLFLFGAAGLFLWSEIRDREKRRGMDCPDCNAWIYPCGHGEEWRR